MIENDIILVKKAENDALELIRKTTELKTTQIMDVQQENEDHIRRRENEALLAISALKKESLESAGREAEFVLATAEKESERLKRVQSSNIALSVKVIVSKITGVEDVLPFGNEQNHDRPP